MKKKILTTKKDFKIFKDEVLKWKDKYNLSGWELYWRHEYTDGAIASVNYDLDARHAIFTLGKDWTDHCGGKGAVELRSTARHELRHLLMARYRLMALSRSITEDQVNEEEHSILHALENAG